VVIIAAVLAAWIELAIVGLPAVPPVPQDYPNNFAGPHGFPLWVRYCRFFNFLFVMLLIRSGLSIVFDHPQLYFNDDCTPGYRHTIGIARVWHFIDVHGFIFTGIFFIIMLFDTEQWRRIVRSSPHP
jgi:methionine sulfoxide reductase catalytic subunit